MNFKIMLFDGPIDEHKHPLPDDEKGQLAIIELGGCVMIPLTGGEYVYEHSVKISEDEIHEIYFWRSSQCP